MKIDLHIHSKDGSDGRWPLPDIFAEASRRGIGFLSITDHDSIQAQEKASIMARQNGMTYLSGVELNVSFFHPSLNTGKSISLDFLGYGFDVTYPPLVKKLTKLRDYRQKRAEMILENVNRELRKEGIQEFTATDLAEIQAGIEGSLGRPHIAHYMMNKKIVKSKQEAFDKYLVTCDVPKLPLGLEEASTLIRSAGGKLVLAHPNDPNGTSLVSVASRVKEQHRIIEEMMLPFLDGIECWHSRHSQATSRAYLAFVREKNLLATGGSDCHQQPLLMGTVSVPEWVAEQFS
ncbi:MAG: PHP domain-containing protein [Desulfomonilia bacterium]